MKTIAASDRGVLVWIGQDHLEDLGHALEQLNHQNHLNPMQHFRINTRRLVSAHKFYVI
jgi:hypothetical protein